MWVPRAVYPLNMLSGTEGKGLPHLGTAVGDRPGVQAQPLTHRCAQEWLLTWRMLTQSL